MSGISTGITGAIERERLDFDLFDDISCEVLRSFSSYELEEDLDLFRVISLSVGVNRPTLISDYFKVLPTCWLYFTYC